MNKTENNWLRKYISKYFVCQSQIYVAFLQQKKKWNPSVMDFETIILLTL